MKKWGVTLLIFLLCVSLGFSIETKGKMEVAIDPWQDIILVDIMFGLPFRIGRLQNIVYFEAKTAVDYKNMRQIDKNILFNDYELGLEMNVNNLYFGFEHECFHPVKIDMPYYWFSYFKVGIEW